MNDDFSKFSFNFCDWSCGFWNDGSSKSHYWFFDLFGEWDFALAFVMGGAVIFNVFSFQFLKNKKPLCSTQQFLPSKKHADRNLVLGAILFGVGWGISGMCPGPALVNLVTFTPSSIIFVVSMLVGMGLFKILEKRLTNS